MTAARTALSTRSARLTSAAAAVLLSLALVAALSQGLHVGHLGAAPEVHELDRVTVTAPVRLAAITPYVVR